jgi:hypothetical protein
MHPIKSLFEIIQIGFVEAGGAGYKTHLDCAGNWDGIVHKLRNFVLEN